MRRKLHLLLIITLSLVALIVTQAVCLAETYYVDAANGNDNNPGTIGEPWKTIQKAALTMVAGDKCIVLSGNYQGDVNITTSGNASNPIIYQANAGAVLNASFNINANYIHVIGFELIGGGIVVNGDYCQVLDNYVHDRMANWTAIGIEAYGRYGTIRGNTIVRAVECGIMVKGQNNLIENNDISHTLTRSPGYSYTNDADGIRFFGSGHTFRGNYIHHIMHSENTGSDPHIDGFQTWGPASNIVFEQNFYESVDTFGSNQIVMVSDWKGIVENLTFRNNIFVMNDPGYSPMSFYWMGGANSIRDITIVHNTFVHRGSTGNGAIQLRSIKNATIKNNIFYDYCNELVKSYVVFDTTALPSENINIGNNCVYNTSGIYPNNGAYPNDLWMIDPNFVDLESTDFHLSSNSACIDKGETLSSVTNDYDGNTRPQGGGYDIGAYEYVLSNQPPVANAGPDQTVTDSDRSGSEEVTLDGSASSDPDGTIVSFVWREGAGQIATGVKPTVTVSTGTHLITLTVTDNGGLTDTDTVTITISSPANQPPVANAGPDQTVTDSDRNGSEQVTLDGSASSDPDGSIVGFIWREGAGQIATGVKPTVTLSTGTHTITLTVTDNGGLTDTDTVTITVSSPANQAPLANAGQDQTVTDSDRNGSEQVTLDGSASFDPDGTIVNFVWTKGATQIATGVKPIVTLSTGTHLITLTVTDNGGLTDTDTVTITVSSPDNQPPLANAGPDQTLTDSDRNGSEQVSLDGSASYDPDGTIVSFVWTKGATQIATGINPKVTLSTGTHLITLTVTDNGGLTDTDTVTITVSSPANQPPLANAGPDQTVTDSDRNGSEQVTLDGSASSDPDGNIVSFVWTKSATQIATGVKPTITLSTGTHTITLTVTDNGGLTDTDTVTITISSPANQPPLANAGQDQTVIDNDRNGSEQVTLDGSASSDPDGSIVGFIWREGATQIATGVKPTVTLSTGRHVIILTVIDNEGSKDGDTVTIKVLKGDRKFGKLPTGCYNNVIKPLKGEGAAIMVELEEPGHIRIVLYDMKGNQIREVADEEKETGKYPYYWDGKDDSGSVVGSGLYFVNIEAGDYKETNKIVVVK